MINDTPYLDGGCSCKIPYKWALDQGYEKIVVVRTREKTYRNEISEKDKHLEKIVYKKYPEFSTSLESINENYNSDCDELQRLEKEGRLFVIAPDEIDISRLEINIEKLGMIYEDGRKITKRVLPELREYLMNR